MKFGKKAKALIISLLAVSLVGGIFGCANQKEAAANKQEANVKKEDPIVITYNSPQQWANWGAVLKEFSKGSSLQAPNDNKNSSQTITALMAEKKQPVADAAYYGIVFGVKAVEEDLVAGYKPPHFEEIPAELKDKDGKWMTIHYGAVAFLVNKEALGTTPVPKSWADLTKPEYKGKVGFLDPTSAAIGYSVATAANLAMGGDLDNWKPAIQFFKELAKNQVINPKQTATAKVLKGEIPILIDADFNGYNMKYVDKGPIEVVIPTEGSLKIPYVVSLVKDAPHPNNGKKLLDYVLSDAGQKMFAEGFVRPIRPTAMTAELKTKFLPESDYARVKDVDFIKMNTNQAAFIELWKSQVAVQ